MKARFVGDPNDGFSGPHKITVWGVDFVKDEWQKVTNPKFARHSHFEFDGDENGEPDLDPEELKKALDDLGVKYHHKAGPAKLAELLEAATAPPAAVEEEGA